MTSLSKGRSILDKYICSLDVLLLTHHYIVIFSEVHSDPESLYLFFSSQKGKRLLLKSRKVPVSQRSFLNIPKYFLNAITRPYFSLLRGLLLVLGLLTPDRLDPEGKSAF